MRNTLDRIKLIVEQVFYMLAGLIFGTCIYSFWHLVQEFMRKYDSANR